MSELLAIGRVADAEQNHCPAQETYLLFAHPDKTVHIHQEIEFWPVASISPLVALLFSSREKKTKRFE